MRCKLQSYHYLSLGVFYTQIQFLSAAFFIGAHRILRTSDDILFVMVFRFSNKVRISPLSRSTSPSIELNSLSCIGSSCCMLTKSSSNVDILLVIDAFLSMSAFTTSSKLFSGVVIGSSSSFSMVVYISESISWHADSSFS